MNSLDTGALAVMLPKLFAAADAADQRFHQAMEQLSPGTGSAAMWSESDYRAMYGRAKDAYLAVAPQTGRLLYLLARTSRARAIVEFGTSFGISTLHLAAALRDNGGGRLITSELESSKADAAGQNLRTAGLSDLVEIRVGDALTTLAADLPEVVDLLLLDGAKGLYPRILELIKPRLREGAVIVADNADRSPVFLDHVRSSAGRYVSLAFGEDVEVSMFSGSSLKMTG